jgi:hypothetical protein
MTLKGLIPALGSDDTTKRGGRKWLKQKENPFRKFLMPLTGMRKF